MIKYGKAEEFRKGDVVIVLGNHSYARDGDRGTVVDVDRCVSPEFCWVMVKFDNYPKDDPMPLFAQHLRHVKEFPNGTTQDQSCSTGSCSW